MPIALPPLSRRRFLSRSLLAGLGLGVAPRLLAAGRAPDPHSWALLSDVHIAADRTTVSRATNMADHLEAVVRELAVMKEKPGGVLISGDLAFSRGEAGDYATLMELLAPARSAGLPVHLALGNHDHRERFWDAVEAGKPLPRPVPGRQTALLRGPRANWFVLDSLEKTLSTPGLLGPEQLDWLARSLDENPRTPALILVHHNPGKLANVEGIRDTEALLKVIRPRRQVKAWFFGHTHNWSVTRDESGIHLVNLPPVAYVFRDTHPSGWVRAGLLRSGIRLELRCVDPQHPAHGSITALKWR